MMFFISDGRLGNQAFQYAFLNSIAGSGEKIFCVNMTQFARYFDYKNVNFVFLSHSKLRLFLYSKVLPRVLNFFVSVRVLGCIEQKRINTIPQPEVHKIKGMLPFTFVKTGFFQTEAFFKGSKIGFKLKKQYEIKAKNVLQRLPKQEKVFIHIRRGDYLSETFEGEAGIELPRQYFIDGIREIEITVKNPFYIFLTDDPSYVHNSFADIQNKFVSEEDLATDLAIMSLCRYGVVSNSSFSWWGAYLAEEKRVMIFPRYWYGWKKQIESHPSIQPSWATVIDVKKSWD